jgi:hypothetical protein
MTRRKKRKGKGKSKSQAQSTRPGRAASVPVLPAELPRNPPTNPDAGRLTAALIELEIARGDDGLLRGKPEPVILVGAYLVRATRVLLLGRSLSRVTPELSFPSTVKVKPDHQLLFDKHFRSDATGRIVLVALALEEDSGNDVTRVYADLEHPARLRIWPAEASMPAPRTLEEIAHDSMWDPCAVPRVHLLVHDADARDTCKDDDFVGACVLNMPSIAGSDDYRRLHFLSDSGKNDWTATLRILLR